MMPVDPHPDELRVVEDHSQTEHKLDLVRRYFGAYLTIIAKARRLPNYREAWIVDTHAGAGLHRSRDDIQGRRFGSPLIACRQAQLAQRLQPGFKVHIRAMERNHGWFLRLSDRVERYRHAEHAEDRVDITVLSNDYARHVDEILLEASSRQALSLWFVDPFGFQDIPYTALAPLTRPQFGPGVLINLDLTGIWRKVGQPTDPAETEEVLVGQPDQQRALRALFDGNGWRAALRPNESRATNLKALAAAYLQVFPQFEHRQTYRLRSSDGQIRYLVHLTHSDLAARTFARCFNDSLKKGLFAGRALDETTRGIAAQALFDAYRGRTTTITELYEEATVPFDRAQLRVILRDAESRHFGLFDEANGVMVWTEHRKEADQTELPFI